MGVGAVGVHHAPCVVTDQDHIVIIIGLTARGSLNTPALDRVGAIPIVCVCRRISPCVMIVEVGSFDCFPTGKVIKWNVLKI